MTLLRSELLEVDDGVGLSRSLWENIDYEKVMWDRNAGFYFFDDFLYGPFADGEKYDGVQATSGSMALSANDGGTLTINSGDSVQHQGYQIQLGGAVGGCFGAQSGVGTKLVLEARLQVTNIANGGIEFFLGLHEDDDTILASGAINNGADDEYVGFVSETDDTAGLVTLICGNDTDNAQSPTVHTFVTSTYVKLGFVYDVGVSAIPYVNGVAATAVTGSLPDSQTLRPSVVCQSNHADDQPTIILDWLAVAKEL